MNLCALGFGSNLKSPARQLCIGLQQLRNLPSTQLLAVAPFYKNPAYGRKSQPHFHNTVALILTRLQPQLLLKYCQSLEKKQGRVRKVRWGSRTLDIDLLFYEDIAFCSKHLTIPHPYATTRPFVMIPFNHLIVKLNLIDRIITKGWV